MGNIGWTGIIIIAILVVILFGKGKISSIMGDLAKGIKSFKKGMSDDNTSGNDSSNNNSDNSNSENKKSYLQASLGERAAVTVAGPIANFILAAFVYFYLALVGTTQLSSLIGEVIPDSLSKEYGISVNDKIVQIDLSLIHI